MHDSIHTSAPKPATRAKPAPKPTKQHASSPSRKGPISDVASSGGYKDLAKANAFKETAAYRKDLARTKYERQVQTLRGRPPISGRGANPGGLHNPDKHDSFIGGIKSVAKGAAQMLVIDPAKDVIKGTKRVAHGDAGGALQASIGAISFIPVGKVVTGGKLVAGAARGAAKVEQTGVAVSRADRAKDLEEAIKARQRLTPRTAPRSTSGGGAVPSQATRSLSTSNEVRRAVEAKRRLEAASGPRPLGGAREPIPTTSARPKLGAQEELIRPPFYVRHVLPKSVLQDANYSAKGISHTFTKHVQDFDGVAFRPHPTKPGKAMSPSTAESRQLRDAIEHHLADPATTVSKGTYHKRDAIHAFNPDTGKNVMFYPDGTLWSGWKLNANQRRNLLERGAL